MCTSYERAKEISAFVTPDGLYQYKVMSFGMKNSQATFQRLTNICLKDVEGVEVYVDDIVIFSDTWEEHFLNKFCFSSKRLFVTPIKAKVKSIIDYPIPDNKKSLMRFLGMAGYYRKFCKNFSEFTAPLTELLKKGVKYHWSEACQKSFDKVKNLLCLEPDCSDFSKPFRLAVDASDVGAGAVLLQSDDEDIEHPVCYLSKKFYVHQMSTIEKECLALILAIQHFDIYISSSSKPTIVYTDHNPLVFFHKMKNKNRRLLNWSLMLQEYSLQIEHVKGKDNICVDVLSRNCV